MGKIILLYPFNPKQRVEPLTDEERIRLKNLLEKNKELIGYIDPMSTVTLRPKALPALETGVIIKHFYGLKLLPDTIDFLSVDEVYPKDFNKLYQTIKQLSWVTNLFLITSHEYVDEFGHYYSQEKFKRLGHYFAVPEGEGILIDNAKQEIRQLHL